MEKEQYNENFVITEKWLKEHNACKESIKAFKKQKTKKLLAVLRKMIRKPYKNGDAYYDWFSWLFTTVIPASILAKWEKACGMKTDEKLYPIDVKYFHKFEEYLKKQKEKK